MNNNGILLVNKQLRKTLQKHVKTVCLYYVCVYYVVIKTIYINYTCKV